MSHDRTTRQLNESRGELINRDCSFGSRIIEAAARLDSLERLAEQKKSASAKDAVEKMRSELCSMLVEHASLRTELGRSDSGLSDDYIAIRRKQLTISPSQWNDMLDSTERKYKTLTSPNFENKGYEPLTSPDIKERERKPKENPNEVFSRTLREYCDRVYPSVIPPLNDVLNDAVELLASVGISLKQIDGDSAEFADANGISRVTVIGYDDVLKDELYKQLLFFLTRLGTADKLIANCGASQEVSEKRSRTTYFGWTHIRWARAFGRVK